MARNKKPRKKRLSKGKTIEVLTESEAKELLSNIVYIPSEEDTEVLDTPCGRIHINDYAGVLNVKNKTLRKRLLRLHATEAIDNDLDGIVEFEKLKVSYPKEPYLYQMVASCYKDLDSERYKIELEKNYVLFPEYPRIATTYAAMFGNELSEEKHRAIVGDEIDIHKRFPEFKSFDVYTVINFISVQFNLAHKAHDIETVMKCVETAKMLHPEGGKTLETQARITFEKGYKSKAMLKSILFLIALLGIVGVVIYFIIRFFRWIF